MKVRVRENHTHEGVSAVVGSMNGLSDERSGNLVNRLSRSQRTEDFAKDSAVDHEVGFNPQERRAHLEASLPITLMCLSVVSKLEENILVALLQDAPLRKFKQKENVLRPGEADDRIHLVIDGVVTLHSYTESGRQIINDYLGRGFFFGETALTAAGGTDFWANSKGGCVIASISRDRFIQVGMSHPVLLKVLTDQLIERLRSADHKACDLAFLDVSGRVANALQQLAKGPCAITHPDGMQIRMTRQEIGLIVGCSREMVGRAIKVLAQDDVIEVNGKNIVVRGAR